MLFDALLNDGTHIVQNEQDVSTVYPSKNCFYDVLQRIEDVARFTVTGKHSYTVDLTDGHFEIDGVTFNAGDPSVSLPAGMKYRLIYFRRVQQTFGVGMIPLSKPFVEYFIGWQTTHEGKNYKTTISVT